MCRKQPTPVDILDNPNLTELDKIIFLYIRPRVRNSDWVYNFEQAWKQYSVELKRWQCIVKVASIAELLQKDRKTIHKSLERLSKWYSEMDNKGMPYWCLITRLHYDKLIEMDNETDNNGTITGQWRDNDGTANKNDKNEKEWKEVIVSEKELREWIDGEAKEWFDSDTKVNPVIARTITAMFTYWYQLDKSIKQLDAIKERLIWLMKLYYKNQDWTLKLDYFELCVNAWVNHPREEKKQSRPKPKGAYNSICNWLVPFEFRKSK